MSKARERRIQRLVREHARLMGIAHWDIDVQFTPRESADDEDAACNADDEYLRATLYFNVPGITEADEPRFVRHELLHAITWELMRVAEHLAGANTAAQEMARAASERVVTTLEKMPLWDRVY